MVVFALVNTRFSDFAERMLFFWYFSSQRSVVYELHPFFSSSVTFIRGLTFFFFFT